MSDSFAFLRTIRTDPADDDARLVFADWLDENGDPKRAEFIRLQIGLKNVSEQWQHTKSEAKRRSRVNELFLAYIAQWQLPWPPLLATMGTREPSDPPAANSERNHAIWRRGFLDEFQCGLDAWETHGPYIVAHHPVRRLRLLNSRPLERFAFGYGGRRGKFMFSWARVSDATMLLGHPAILPNHVPDEIADGLRQYREPGYTYSTHDDAIGDLQATALDWAREKVKLPPLRFPAVRPHSPS